MRNAFLKKTTTYPVETEVITYKRKKAKGVRQAIFNHFTPEIVHHELQGEDCICPDCHGQLKEIGSTVQRQELVFIPAQLKRVDHIQHAYKCQACSQKNPSDKIIKAPVPKAPLAHSLGSASISLIRFIRSSTSRCPITVRKKTGTSLACLSVGRR